MKTQTLKKMTAVFTTVAIIVMQGTFPAFGETFYDLWGNEQQSVSAPEQSYSDSADESGSEGGMMSEADQFFGQEPISEPDSSDEQSVTAGGITYRISYEAYYSEEEPDVEVPQRIIRSEGFEASVIGALDPNQNMVQLADGKYYSIKIDETGRVGFDHLAVVTGTLYRLGEHIKTLFCGDAAALGGSYVYYDFNHDNRVDQADASLLGNFPGLEESVANTVWTQVTQDLAEHYGSATFSVYGYSDLWRIASDLGGGSAETQSKIQQIFSVQRAKNEQLRNQLHSRFLSELFNPNPDPNAMYQTYLESRGNAALQTTAMNDELNLKIETLKAVADLVRGVAGSGTEEHLTEAQDYLAGVDALFNGELEENIYNLANSYYESWTEQAVREALFAYEAAEAYRSAWSAYDRAVRDAGSWLDLKYLESHKPQLATYTNPAGSSLADPIELLNLAIPEGERIFGELRVDFYKKQNLEVFSQLEFITYGGSEIAADGSMIYSLKSRREGEVTVSVNTCTVALSPGTRCGTHDVTVQFVRPTVAGPAGQPVVIDLNGSSQTYVVAPGQEFEFKIAEGYVSVMQKARPLQITAEVLKQIAALQNVAVSQIIVYETQSPDSVFYSFRNALGTHYRLIALKFFDDGRVELGQPSMEVPTRLAFQAELYRKYFRKYDIPFYQLEIENLWLLGNTVPVIGPQNWRIDFRILVCLNGSDTCEETQKVFQAEGVSQWFAYGVEMFFSAALPADVVKSFDQAVYDAIDGITAGSNQQTSALSQLLVEAQQASTARVAPVQAELYGAVNQLKTSYASVSAIIDRSAPAQPDELTRALTDRLALEHNVAAGKISLYDFPDSDSVFYSYQDNAGKMHYREAGFTAFEGGHVELEAVSANVSLTQAFAAELYNKYYKSYGMAFGDVQISGIQINLGNVPVVGPQNYSISYQVNRCLEGAPSCPGFSDSIQATGIREQFGDEGLYSVMLEDEGMETLRNSLLIQMKTLLSAANTDIKRINLAASSLMRTVDSQIAANKSQLVTKIGSLKSLVSVSIPNLLNNNILSADLRNKALAYLEQTEALFNQDWIEKTRGVMTDYSTGQKMALLLQLKEEARAWSVFLTELQAYYYAVAQSNSLDELRQLQTAAPWYYPETVNVPTIENPLTAWNNALAQAISAGQALVQELSQAARPLI